MIKSLNAHPEYLSHHSILVPEHYSRVTPELHKHKDQDHVKYNRG